MATKKIGILCGFEETFPPAFINKVNELGGGDITADYVRLSAPRMGEPSGYDLIVDRISHEIATYKPFLKHAVLTGTYVVNDPFWWLADDKFFDAGLVSKLGVAHPKTVVLPSKQRFPRTTEKSYRNQELVDWKSVIEYIGFPAILKPYDGGGWRNVYKVNNVAELFRAYEETNTLVMIMQECIDFDDYFRCLAIGKDNILPIRYNPRAYFHERYVAGTPDPNDPLVARVIRDSKTICHALGYDMNSVEFACKDGIPYAIDFMNPAPDMDYHSVRPENFEWAVAAMAEMCVKYVKEGRKMDLSHPWQKALSAGKPVEVSIK